MFNTKTVGGIHNFQTGPDKQFIIEKMFLKPRIVPNFMRNMKTSFAHGNFKTEEREANSQNKKCEWFHNWVILGSVVLQAMLVHGCDSNMKGSWAD